MRLAIVLSLVLAVLAVVFALQNPGFTDVSLGAWDIRGSTALILMVTFGVGVLVGLLATVPTLVRRKRRIKQLERDRADLDTTVGSAFPTTEPDAGYVPPEKV